MRIVFIPGWGSTGESKVAKLKELFPNDLVTSVVLDYQGPYGVLEAKLVRYSHFAHLRRCSDEMIIVGHSLGALFARKLSRMIRCPCIMINPSLTPEHSTIAGHLGFEPREVRVNTDEYAPVQEYAIIEDGDEVVDYQRAFEMHLFDRTDVINVPGGDHKFQSWHHLTRLVESLRNGYFEFPVV